MKIPNESGRANFRQFVAENASMMPPREIPLEHIIPSGIPTMQPMMVPASNQPDALPDFKSMADIKVGKIELPEVLIEDVLHRGCKMVIAGGSKSFKSWSLIDLALAISEGGEWWGHRCRMGKVLYLNFELIGGFFEQRIMTVAQSRKSQINPNFLFWNLRGKCYDLVSLSRVIQARIHQMGKVDLIVVDPIYKALGDLDENSAGDMSLLMQKVETLSDSVGASVVFGAHFSKGNQSAKESIDRMSGSGVFARDPDVIMTMTRHQDKGSYVIESELRYLPPIPEFVVTWEYPRMRIDEGKDPKDLYDPNKRPKEEPPQVSQFTDRDILECLPYSGLNDVGWKTVVIQKFGNAGNRFYQAKERLIGLGQVQKDGNRYVRVNLDLT